METKKCVMGVIFKHVVNRKNGNNVLSDWDVKGVLQPNLVVFLSAVVVAVKICLWFVKSRNYSN